MKNLSIANQIKIIKDAGLKVPVYRSSTEDYDALNPYSFDRSIAYEAVEVNSPLNYLLGIIQYLSKEILIMSTDRAINKQLWDNLKEIRAMVKEQHNTVGDYHRR